MNKLVIVIVLLFTFFTFPGCKRSEETGVSKSISNDDDSSQRENSTKPLMLKSYVDVIKLANKSQEFFENEFGGAIKVTEIKNNPRLMPGEFREYKVQGHPKNLSIRFYKGEAKRFNLLLGAPEKSGVKALERIFKIDVGEMKRVKTDVLSENWSGTSNGVKLKTAYAKRGKSGGDFVMLHAEVSD